MLEKNISESCHQPGGSGAGVDDVLEKLEKVEAITFADAGCLA